MDRTDAKSGTEAEEGGTTDGRAAFAMPRPSPTLTALTTSALALPGLAGTAQADAPVERATGSSSFSYYREGQLPQRKLGSGSPKRYEVFTKQLRFDIPTSARTDLGIDFLYEEMSGASPWFVQVDATTGNLVQAMSGATITDERTDLVLDLDYYLDQGKDTISGGFSLEKDYLSIHAGLGTERNFNDKNTTLNLSGAFAYDWLRPTDAGRFVNRPGEEEKWSIDLFAGLSQILTRAAVAQVTINYKHSDGYLGDPYKEIQQLGGGNFSDERPDAKDQVSVLARLRYHFEDVNGSAHFDYRLYADSWSVVSHTFEVAWYQRFFDWLTVAPGFRWYSQSKADFYEPVLQIGTVPRHRTSDYRQSPFGALSAKIKFEAEVLDLFSYDAPRFLQSIGITEGMDLIAAVSYEYYMSDGHFGLTSVGEFEQAPALLDFQVWAFTLSGRF